MTPDNFIPQYEQALASQQWSQVAPLIHEDACVTFSTGAVHRGKAAVQQAYEGNFSAIEGEHYQMHNVHWVKQTSDVAVYLFDFTWSGRIGGREAAGSGRGTAVIIRDGDAWQLIAEHLGPKS